MPVLWQFRQILESFDTGSIIQGAYMEVTEQKKKKNVYIRKCCLQNIKMSDTRWAFFFNSMGSKKTKSCFLTLSRLEQSATYQSIFRNLTKVVVPLSMCHRNLLKGGCHQCEVLIVYLEKARAGENIACKAYVRWQVWTLGPLNRQVKVYHATFKVKFKYS